MNARFVFLQIYKIIILQVQGQLQEPVLLVHLQHQEPVPVLQLWEPVQVLQLFCILQLTEIKMQRTA
ncbi:hypothetical protein SMITH_86 [Smithella sp. ME-1]|nr:hypothetical protein SMITH_86 [Smithella sp. ME-1]